MGIFNGKIEVKTLFNQKKKKKKLVGIHASSLNKIIEWMKSHVLINAQNNLIIHLNVLVIKKKTINILDFKN